ncbi:MAG: glycosyltransferase family 9 protein [Chitinophagaceae bacterium]|nr:glycosyltransferase family 9 protein [Chitinophagaceae bacterium]
MQKILVIQTAFIGDLVLATALVESLHEQYPQASIDIVVRKGNEPLFNEHPFINELIVWDKKNSKYLNWLSILKKMRVKNYDVLINLQRFAATGLWTILANANTTIGFDKNPFSFLFTHKVKHDISTLNQNISASAVHEINRNHALTSSLGEFPLAMPKLYPTKSDYEKVKVYQAQKYITIAPASVWFTKQFPLTAWVSLINELKFEGPIYILGGPADKALGDAIVNEVLKLNSNTSNISTTSNASSASKKIINLSGELGFLASAALQQKAVINYVNDSAPMHFCSAVNAPVVAIYCSTIPAFGFGPLSTNSFIVETQEKLACRPCGLHGKKQCPLGHFNCAQTIENAQLIAPLLQMAQH